MVAIFIPIILFFSVYKASLEDNKCYLSKEQTTCINGVFITIVFLSHSNQYINLVGFGGRVFSLFLAALGQMMVVMFLFYSGYGLFEQYKTKDNYIKNFMYHRVFKTWIHFVMAVALYLLLNIILSNEYTLKEICLSFTGWESIGNSNWYIFDILVMYICFYLAVRLSGFVNEETKRVKIVIIISWLLTLILWILLAVCKPEYWYNTVVAFPMGMTYSYWKDKIEELLNKKSNWTRSCIVVILLFCILYSVRNAIGMSVSAILFSLIIVMLTMKIRIQNRFLEFMGNNLFSIYIFQRMPMIVLSDLGITNPTIFILISFMITIIIAVLINKYIYTYIDKFLCF